MRFGADSRACGRARARCPTLRRRRPLGVVRAGRRALAVCRAGEMPASCAYPPGVSARSSEGERPVPDVRTAPDRRPDRRRLGERAKCPGRARTQAGISPVRGGMRRDAAGCGAADGDGARCTPEATAGTTNAPAPWGAGACVSGSGRAVRCPQSGNEAEGTQAAWRTNWTSRLIVTSLPSVKPPASSAAFQFTPNSVRSILVVASAPNLTWP